MSASPDISVVMGVYNGGSRLRETMDSVLSQEDVSLEFVVVNDGSTDDTAQILEDYAQRDARVKIIHRENQGLTKSLIEGCAVARGKYIARQDAGDVSLPGRLRKQLDEMSSHPGASAVSGGTRFVGPEREQLYEVVPATLDLTAPLLELELDKIKGPSMHGCTMFPKEKYEQVGGYRAAFYFAQDLDLWIRMAEIGKHIAIPDIVYEASLTIGAISSRYRKQQVETARLILESTRLRRQGTNDDEVLQKAGRIRSRGNRTIGRFERANALYFIGACLRQRRSPDAPHYFQRAFLTHPLHLKSALRLLTG
jgi:glycosyltransferase involved in cell wall biosynthesis